MDCGNNEGTKQEFRLHCGAKLSNGRTFITFSGIEAHRMLKGKRSPVSLMNNMSCVIIYLHMNNGFAMPVRLTRFRASRWIMKKVF